MNIFKDVLNVIKTAAGRMFGNWGTLLISLAIYICVVALNYFLIFYMGLDTAIGVFLYLILIPASVIALFFVMQVQGLSYVRRGVGPVYLLKRAWIDFPKLLAVSLLILLVIIPMWLYLYVNLEGPFDATWKTYIVEGLRIILMYILLPAVTIQLWLSAISEGVLNSVKNFGRIFIRAVEPQALLIYLLITAVFATITYFLFFKETQWGSQWTELWLIGIRVTLAFLVIFFGWLLLLGSLAEWKAQRAIRELDKVPESKPQPSEKFVVSP